MFGGGAWESQVLILLIPLTIAVLLCAGFARFSGFADSWYVLSTRARHRKFDNQLFLCLRKPFKRLPTRSPKEHAEKVLVIFCAIRESFSGIVATGKQIKKQINRYGQNLAFAFPSHNVANPIVTALPTTSTK